MKKTKEYIKRRIVDEIVLVPSGSTAEEFNGMITISESGEFIWDHIEECNSFEELIELMLQEYDIDRETATNDTIAFVTELLRLRMIEPTNNNW